MRAPFAAFAFLCFGGGELAAASRAHAGDPAGAQALFSEGKRLLDAGRAVEACPKLQESQRLDPAIGTAFQLAQCHERTGKTATAWAEYLEVAAMAKSSGQGAREAVAREHARALEGAIPKLRVIVAARNTPGLKVARDGVEVGRGEWDTALPVDPGDHRFVASAPGRTPLEKTVRVPAAGRTVDVTIPDLGEGGAPVAAAAHGASPVPSGDVLDHADVDVTSSGSSQRAAGVALGAGGLAGIGVGIGFGLASRAKRDDANAHCVGDRCDSVGAGLRSDALNAGNVSTVAFIAGGAVLLTGIVVFAASPHSQIREVSLSPTFSPSEASMKLAARF